MGPGHRPGARLEASLPHEFLGQGPDWLRVLPGLTLSQERKELAQGPRCLGQRQPPQTQPSDPLQPAEPAGPDLSRKIPQELHCLQQRSPLGCWQGWQKGVRSQGRGESQMTPHEQTRGGPPTRQPLRQDPLGLPACTQPRAHPWGHLRPDATSCSQEAHQVGEGGLQPPTKHTCQRVLGATLVSRAAPPPGGPPMKEIGPLPTHAAGGQGEGEQVYFLVPEVSLGNPGPTPSP